MKQGFILICCAGLINCQGYSVTGGPGPVNAPSLMTKVERTSDLLHLNSLFVLPVAYDVAARAQADPEIDEELKDAFSREMGVALVFAREVAREFRPNPTTRMDPVVKREDALRIAAQHGSDAVLAVQVHSIVQREGSSLGASQGARLSFSVAAHRIPDGREIWSGSYSFTDQALSENLFRAEKRGLGGGVGWKSTRLLFAAGFEAAAKDLAKRRNAEFMSAPQQGG